MRKAEEFIPLISVIIWTCGLGGLLPAPFFAEIYKQTNVINQILIITIKKERAEIIISEYYSHTVCESICAFLSTCML